MGQASYKKFFLIEGYEIQLKLLQYLSRTIYRHILQHFFSYQLLVLSMFTSLISKKPLLKICIALIVGIALFSILLILQQIFGLHPLSHRWRLKQIRPEIRQRTFHVLRIIRPCRARAQLLDSKLTMESPRSARTFRSLSNFSITLPNAVET